MHPIVRRGAVAAPKPFHGGQFGISALVGDHHREGAVEGAIIGFERDGLPEACRRVFELAVVHLGHAEVIPAGAGQGLQPDRLAPGSNRLVQPA